jgi:hypothetical protein
VRSTSGSQRKLDCTQEEARVLKEIMATLSGSGKLSFTADHRRRLAIAGKALNPEERKKCRQIVKPGTILRWFCQIVAGKSDSSKAKVGRPRKKKAIRKLVIEMALANFVIERKSRTVEIAGIAVEQRFRRAICAFDQERVS